MYERYYVSISQYIYWVWTNGHPCYELLLNRFIRIYTSLLYWSNMILNAKNKHGIEWNMRENSLCTLFRHILLSYVNLQSTGRIILSLLFFVSFVLPICSYVFIYYMHMHLYCSNICLGIYLWYFVFSFVHILKIYTYVCYIHIRLA